MQTSLEEKGNSMTRYERRELSHDWKDIRPLLKDSAQITYEVIRPVLLFGVSPKERAEETGISKSSIYYKANLFDQAGMASLFPPTPPPDVPRHQFWPHAPHVVLYLRCLHLINCSRGTQA